MDLKTRIINEVMISYCVSIYDGKEFESFYLSDFKDEREMLRASIISLMKRKYHNYKVYLHNFSHFDGIFILKILSVLTDSIIKPIYRDGNIIDLKFPYCSSTGSEQYNLYFRDSYLLLPSSLKKLALNFNLKEQKGIFPYNFVNQDNIQLDYKGPIPSYDFFNKISIEEYNIYANDFKDNN